MKQFWPGNSHWAGDLSRGSIGWAALLVFLIAVRTSGWAAAPDWLARPPELMAPTGTVVRVSNVEQLLAAGEQMVPGSALLIEPGVYPMPRPLVLRGKQNVTLRSVSGEPASVTLKGKGWASGDPRDDIMHIADCDGVFIAGLTFADARSYGVKVEAEHGPKNVHIFNCRFRDIGIRAIKGSAGKDPDVRARRGSVRFCDFENSKNPPSDWLFGGNYIAAIDMMALENWTFSDNVFRNIQGNSGGGRAAIFIWVRSRRIVVERNLIVNCDRGISFGNPGQSTANNPGEAPLHVAEGIIQNNIIAGGADGGIELWQVTGIKVRHNSVWRPERNWQRGIRVGTGTDRTEIVNNLVHGGIQSEGGRAEVHHNLAGRLNDFFVDPATGNLTLTASATEAIDRAVALPDAPNDFRKLPRQNAPDLGALEFGGAAKAWVEPMKKVHARFKGAAGTFVQMGDSITFSGAFWSPLAVPPRKMSATAEANYRLVTQHLKPETLQQKGPTFGNQGSMTMRWAAENLTNWLATLNPEVAVLMFGSNDIWKTSVAEFEKNTRDVVARCLTNGTIVLLTTPPPQSTRLEHSLEFAAVIRKIATEFGTPLVDFAGEILTRRPFDWDGAAAEFKAMPSDTYEVPTLISRDGVHPSNPNAFFNDFSDEALSASGYGLRNYLTLMAYAEVIREIP